MSRFIRSLINLRFRHIHCTFIFSLSFSSSVYAICLHFCIRAVSCVCFLDHRLYIASQWQCRLVNCNILYNIFYSWPIPCIVHPRSNCMERIAGVFLYLIVQHTLPCVLASLQWKTNFLNCSMNTFLVRTVWYMYIILCFYVILFFFLIELFCIVHIWYISDRLSGPWRPPSWTLNK